jgi:hypothetical protein
MKKLTVQILVLILILSLSLQAVPISARSEENLSPITPQTKGQESIKPPFPQEEEHFGLLPDRVRPYQHLLQDPDLPPELHKQGPTESSAMERRDYTAPSSEQLAQTQAQGQNFDCNTVTDVDLIECEALVALYDSTNGAGWANSTNWLVSNTVGNWYGVTVTSGNVTDLSLSDNNLSGSIPPELGSLTNLGSLCLDSNQLNGSIPPQLGGLNNLETLFLHFNQLNGSIPTQLGSLSKLNALFLYNNNLSGSIPLSFINLTALEHFHFYETSLCEPNTPEFLVWKATVDNWTGTGNICLQLYQLFLPLLTKQ